MASNETPQQINSPRKEGEEVTVLAADGNSEGNQELNPLYGRAKKRRSNSDRHLQAKERKRRRRDLAAEQNVRAANAEAVVYYKNGLRHVQPYMFTFTVKAKERWFGRTVLDVFSTEFCIKSVDNLQMNLRAGNLKLSGVVADADTIITQGHTVNNTAHRHEPPVTDQAIKVIHNDEDMFVIDKPSSVPVHPSGPYRHNTVQFILARDHGQVNLRGVHRLDRLTSGVLMFCKTYEKAREMAIRMKDGEMQKTYLARVVGEFPSGEVVVDQPMEGLTHKFCLVSVSPTGKEARTRFQRVHHDGYTSVVKCWPTHGRTHQIRVHLRYLGHPIINDPLYNHPSWRHADIAGADEVHKTHYVLRFLLHQMMGAEDGEKEFQSAERLRSVHDGTGGASEQPEAADATAAAAVDSSEHGGSKEKPVDVPSNCRLPVDSHESTGGDSKSCDTAVSVSNDGPADCSSAVRNAGLADGVQVSSPHADDSKCSVRGADQSETSGKPTSSAAGVTCAEYPSSSDPDRIGACSDASRAHGEAAPYIAENGSECPTATLPTKASSPKRTPEERGEAIAAWQESVVQLEKELQRPSLADCLPLEQPPRGGDHFREACWTCTHMRPDPQPEDLIMFLHALSYEGDGFKFETPLPDWAREGWQTPEYLLNPDAMAHANVFGYEENGSTPSTEL